MGKRPQKDGEPMKKMAVKKFLAGILILSTLFGMPIVTHATSTQDQLNQAEQDKKDLEDQLDNKQDEVDGLKGKKKDLQKKLNQLNEELTKISEHLEELEQSIADKEIEISETEEALAEARETEKWQYECMKKRIQFMYERNNNMYLEALFSMTSFSDFLNFSEYLEEVAAYDQKMLAEYEATRKFIESEEVRLNNEKVELEALKVEAEAEKSRIAGIISQTSNGIAEYSGQIDEAEKEALAYEEALRKKEEDIKVLKKKLEEELAMSQLAANSKWRDISEVSFADGDRYLLANLIYCEAGGEPDAGKLAVGAVVINRVLSSVYPDTVVGVIYQKSQFSPAASGRLALALQVNKATPACYAAADQAMSGMTNVGNCLHFRTPIEGLTGITIGGHIFY